MLFGLRALPRRLGWVDPMEWLQTMGWFMNKEGPVRYARPVDEATLAQGLSLQIIGNRLF